MAVWGDDSLQEVLVLPTKPMQIGTDISAHMLEHIFRNMFGMNGYFQIGFHLRFLYKCKENESPCQRMAGRNLR